MVYYLWLYHKQLLINIITPSPLYSTHPAYSHTIIIRSTLPEFNFKAILYTTSKDRRSLTQHACILIIHVYWKLPSVLPFS